MRHTVQPRLSFASVALVATIVTSCLATSGCKFGRLTNAYIDHVDCKNDRCVLYLDHLYCPACDLTRAGKPDWCQTVCPSVASHTCKTREGARDVPEPVFVVYPQPEIIEDGPGYGFAPSTPPEDMTADELQLESERLERIQELQGGLIPPQPGELNDEN